MNLMPDRGVEMNNISGYQLSSTLPNVDLERNMKALIKQVIIVFYLSITLGCAGPDPVASEGGESEVSSRSDCISQGSIRDYRVLDDANLMVTERSSRKYHVELSRRAYGLRTSHGIAFESDSSRICGRFDDLVFDGSFGTERVTIASIRRLTPEQEEDLLIRFGIIEPEYKQPRQPVELEGAEVEELD
jgi:hypothetical protein